MISRMPRKAVVAKTYCVVHEKHVDGDPSMEGDGDSSCKDEYSQ